jgi:phosphatidylglycerophosphate synthase
LWRVERPKLALPTLVTAFRIALTACLGVWGMALSGREIVVGVLVVFSLDGLDGFLARRLSAVSRLGAQLDNEGDAFLVAVVCVLSWLTVPLGAWILVAGFLRYVYVLTAAVFSSHGHAPPSRLATRAFGISLVGFLIGLANLGVISRVAPLLSTLLLLWSFSRSFYWSLRKA